MVKIESEKELGKVEQYLKAIFKDNYKVNEDGNHDLVIDIGKKDRVALLEEPNRVSIPHGPEYWIESRKREAELANWLKIAACLRILTQIDINS